MTVNEMYDFLNEYVGIEACALDLAFGLNGFNEETAQKILYWATGYRYFNHYMTDMGLTEWEEEE